MLELEMIFRIAKYLTGFIGYHKGASLFFHKQSQFRLRKIQTRRIHVTRYMEIKTEVDGNSKRGSVCYP